MPDSKRHNREAEVLPAAVEVFHEKGYLAATVSDIAANLGILKGTLYHYIDSKEDLLAEIFDQSDRQSLALMDGVNSLDRTAVERMRIFVWLRSMWSLENIERAGICISELKNLNAERRRNVLRTQRELNLRLRGLVEDMKREGVADPGLDAACASAFVSSVLNGLATSHRPGRIASPERIAGTYSEMVISALCRSGRC